MGSKSFLRRGMVIIGAQEFKGRLIKVKTFLKLLNTNRKRTVKKKKLRPRKA